MQKDRRSLAMYQCRHNDLPKWYFACTEVVLQKHMYRNWSHMYRSRHVPKLSIPVYRNCHVPKATQPISGVPLCMLIFVIEIVIDFSEHYKRSISLHYKINTIGDPSLPIINLHYKRSISYNEKRFSLITLKLLRIPKSLCCRFCPLISLQSYI